MLLSLIQTSQCRKQELARFIHSLNAQTGIDFSQVQLIFVDQEDNLPVFQDLHPDIDFTYIPYHRCSLSRARNIGLEQVKGRFVGFPDDDCWYDPDTLQSVLSCLLKGTYQGVSGKGCDETGDLIAPFPVEKAELTATKHCGSLSITLFFLYDPEIRFDERVGVGSPYGLGSGEETDYLLQLMLGRKYNVCYDPSITVRHPNEKHLVNVEKAYYYARGAGFLARKHPLPFSYKARLFLRPLLGMMCYLFVGKINRMKKSFYLLKGRIEGYTYQVK